MTKQALIDLEQKVITVLDFDLQFDGPIPLLERYLRVFNLDLGKFSESEDEPFMITVLAFAFLKMVLHSRIFLALKPSQIAAAALTLAINISTCPVVT